MGGEEMRVVGFYTKDSPYEAEASRLAASLRACEMPYSIRRVDAASDWYEATLRKPFVIRELREDFSGPLLYNDVDAVFHENCESYFDGIDADFACHYFQDTRLLSGTMWFADNDNARRLLDAWCAMNTMLKEYGCREGGGQKNLWYVTTCMPWLKIHRMPGRYCYVFDKSWAYPVGEPRVIEHLIASRENRGESRGRENASRRARIAQLEGASA